MKKLLLTLLLFAASLSTLLAQSRVSGTVYDETGEPLPGATVVVKGTSFGVATDFDGNFVISAESSQVLVVSYIGYKNQEVTVGSQSTIEVYLELGNQLDEVVVTGFGRESKKSFAGAAKVVTGENISQKSFTNVSQALAGEAAGVNVIRTSGLPGSSSSVRIRGFGSINGNADPLYIVDDAPFQGSLNDINPNDIASVTVLKDASATALYGSQGASGVIVITTKKGSDLGDKIDVTIKSGINYEGMPRYDRINSPEEYMNITWDGLYQRGRQLIASGEVSTDEYANATIYANERIFGAAGIDPMYNMWAKGPAGTTERPDWFNYSRRYTPEDWNEFAFQDANRQEVFVGISNSSDRSSVYTSFGYVDDQSYAINSDYKRINARLRSNQKFGDAIEISNTLAYNYDITNNAGNVSNSSSQFWWVNNLPPIYPLFLRDENGEKIEDPIYGGFLYDYGLQRGFGPLTNGVADSFLDVNRTKAHAINFNQDLRIDLFSGLTFENNTAVQYTMSNYDNLDEPFYSPAKGAKGSIYKSKSQTVNYSVRTGLRYAKDWDDFTMDVFVNHLSQKYENNFMSAAMQNLVRPDGLELDNAVVLPYNPGSDTQAYSLESYVGNMNLGLKDRYFLTASFNRDGSSRFVNEKWGNFYALGLSYVISDEAFFNVNGIDYLKLRGSYGSIGEARGNGFYPGFDLFSIQNLDDKVSLSFDTKGNKDLTWERSDMLDLGLEFGLFSGVIDGEIGYYQKTINDMFFSRRVGPSAGYALLDVNDGSIMTSGVEFDIDFNIVNTRDASLSIGVIGESFAEEFKALPLDPSTGLEQKFQVDGLYGWETGRSRYEYYIREYAGVDPQTGKAQWFMNFVDNDFDGEFTDGDEVVQSLTQYLLDNPEATIAETKTDVYNDATRRFVDKTFIPDVRGAFRVNASVKNFNLSVLFNYSLGGYIFDSGYQLLMDNENPGNNAFHVDMRNRWQNIGDITDVPIYDANLQVNQNGSSTRFLTKGDYIALNNVRFGYTLPSDFINKVGFKRADLFVTGDNLFVTSSRRGLNPTTSQTGGSNYYKYNPLSTLTLGINLNL